MKQKTTSSAFQSILLLFFSYAPAFIMYLAIHELGHATVDLIHGATITRFVVHPFFVSYVISTGARDTIPILESYGAGAVMALSVSSLIGIMFWKRRSISNLPLQMLFPTALIMQGIESSIALTDPSSDFYHIMQATGLPAILFYGIGFVLIGRGIFFFNSLFPLLGLAPEDRKSLLIIPAGLSLYSVLVVVFAYFFEPTSHEAALHLPVGFAIIRANNFLIIGGILGVILAVVYATLYGRFYRRLPPSLQTEKSKFNLERFTNTWSTIYYLSGPWLTCLQLARRSCVCLDRISIKKINVYTGSYMKDSNSAITLYETFLNG